MTIRFLIPVLLAAAAAAAPRPMNFLDVLELRQVQSGVLSKDGRRFVYAVSQLDWKAGKRETDLFLAEGGASRQLTYSQGKSESAPAFSPDGQSLAFLSDRDGSNQLYLLSLKGGEARKISTLPAPAPRSSVTAHAFSEDGRWIAYLAGTPEASQLYLYDVAGGNVEALTRHDTGVESGWRWAPDSSRIFFLAPDARPKVDRQRIELKFDVRISDAPKAPSHLWQVALAGKAETRLTSGSGYSVRSIEVSRDGAWIVFTGRPPDRYSLNSLDGAQAQEVYLFEVATKRIEQLTKNAVAEASAHISPDSRWIAFRSAEDFTPYRRDRAYVRPVRGGEWRPLPAGWDHEVGDLIWSKDASRLSFVSGVGLNRNLYAIDLSSGELRRVTQHTGVIAASYHFDSDQFILAVESPGQPKDYYVAAADSVGDASRWRRQSSANPSLAEIALGRYEAVQWKSSDGQMVEGILVKPVGYETGKRYPLIVQIHGGPASAFLNGFSGTYGSYVHVFAGGGYAVFQPNYRGSTNYGERFRMEIAGDYFRQAFDDIMSGVDELIRKGITDPDKMGFMGWSAGGHWSNWTLTHTDRFKAISSGAGAVNWISMYGQTDMQAVREFYFKGKPWENWDHFVEVSPLRYITKAKTPTLIHVGEDDERVPRPQSQELYVALKKLGVPCEFIVYPNMGHGLTEPRYQYVKMASEYAWFEKWIRGKSGWLTWEEIVATVPK